MADTRSTQTGKAPTGKTRTGKTRTGKTGKTGKKDTRKQAIVDMDRLVASLDDLVAQLAVVRGQYGKARRSLNGGDSVETALTKARAAETRESITLALDDFEKCRHVSRRSLIAAGLDEGMSINAQSKVWGVSRQLISR